MALEEMGRNCSNGYGVLELGSFHFLVSRSQETVETLWVGYAMIPDAGASEFLLLLFSSFWFRAHMD
jgi:hypothetical protein